MSKHLTCGKPLLSTRNRKHSDKGDEGDVISKNNVPSNVACGQWCLAAKVDTLNADARYIAVPMFLLSGPAAFSVQSTRGGALIRRLTLTERYDVGCRCRIGTLIYRVSLWPAWKAAQDKWRKLHASDGKWRQASSVTG